MTDYINLVGGALLRSPSNTTWEYKITQNINELPSTFRLWDSPIKNQQTKSTCVAHALASAIEIMQHYDSGGRDQISTSWFYGYREPDDFQEDGMYISEALEMARKIGGVPKSLMPDNLNYKESLSIISDMKNKCLEVAKYYKIKNYAYLKSKYEIMSVIYTNKAPVIMGIQTYESFVNVNSTGVVPEPSFNENTYGGHAVLCIGWTTINDEFYLVIKNSWGESWGDNGYAYMRLNGYIPTYEIYALFDEIDHPLSLSDVDNHWSKDDIELAIRCGILNGYPDGTFKPDNTVTRGELASVVAKLLKKTALY